MPGKWHRGGGPVMPVRHDVHRTCSTAFFADETPSNRRPGQILRQSIEPNVDHASITGARRALNVASHMTYGDPFRWCAERPSVR